MSSFDFRHIFNKYNIDRHRITSKKEKEENNPDLDRILDIFEKKTEKDYVFLENIIKEVHKNFKEHVLNHRINKLTNDNKNLESILNADIFLGEESCKLG